MWKLSLTSVAAGAVAFASGAHAVTYSSPSSLALIDFGTGLSSGLQTSTSPGTIAGETFTISSSGNPSTGVYAGTTANAAISPFGVSSLKSYLAAEPGGSITISFSMPQTTFGLLWGSVDSYNDLSFTAGGTVISGTSVAGALGFPANGTVTEDVLISGLPTFTSILIQSGTAAFEFVPGVPIPEPMSAALVGMGVVGLSLLRRRSSPR